MKTWIVGVAAISLASSALSQPANGGGIRRACGADIQKFCGDVARGGGRVRQCMIQHRNDLSPDCQAALANARTDRPHPNQGPHDDSAPQD